MHIGQGHNDTSGYIYICFFTDPHHRRLFHTISHPSYVPPSSTTTSNNITYSIQCHITAINNCHPTKRWMDLPTIPLLSRVQPLPTAYGTNNVINDTAELLTRVLACELLPHDTPTIVIYDSTVVHSQRLVLFGTSYTNRQRTRTYFPAIIWILA